MSSVSVVIPCFNARPWIAATLDSVRQQQLPDTQVILVDDGSSDGSGELVAASYPEVQVIRTDNGGPSRARNLGTRLARGEFVQYLDADDLLAPGKLHTQLDVLARSGADVAYGDWQELRPDTERPGRVVERHIDGDPEIALFTDFWCPPAAYLFRRRSIEHVAWHAVLPIIQDARFALDCALRGARFAYCPGIMARYRAHTAGSVSTRDSAAFTRDCFRNATEIEHWWAEHGGIQPARNRALVKVYGQVARASFERDQDLFDAACAALVRLQPGYVPEHPRHLRLASQLVGYRRAEALAARYRRAKHLVQHGHPARDC